MVRPSIFSRFALVTKGAEDEAQRLVVRALVRHQLLRVRLHALLLDLDPVLHLADLGLDWLNFI